MIRVEIIANHSVEENILESLKDEGVGKHYTRYPNILGVGTSGPRMGDAVWPEENFALVIWCEAEEARGLERAVAKVKALFPDEGIKLFSLGGSALGDNVDQRPPAAVAGAAEAAPTKPPLPDYAADSI